MVLEKSVQSMSLSLKRSFDLAKEELEDFVDPTNDSSQQDEAFSPRVAVVDRATDSLLL